MEAFANQDGVRTAWSSQTTSLGGDGTKVLLTAVVLENAGATATMRGIKIELSGDGSHDVIYLDEEATERTRAALEEINNALATRRNSSGCMGAREFWPMYDWPWNKYHEFNADACGDDSTLVLSGRGKTGAYRLQGENPTTFAAILTRAIADLKEH
jgi:hypothetical protein